MVGGGLGRDRDTVRLADPDQVDGGGGADVGQMEPAAGRAGKRNVAGDGDLLGFGGDAA